MSSHGLLKTARCDVMAKSICFHVYTDQCLRHQSTWNPRIRTNSTEWISVASKYTTSYKTYKMFISKATYLLYSVLYSFATISCLEVIVN